MTLAMISINQHLEMCPNYLFTCSIRLFTFVAVSSTPPPIPLHSDMTAVFERIMIL